MTRRNAFCQVLACTLAVGLALSPTPILRAADHRDAPGVNTRGDGDIGDIFAFLNPNDRGRLVLVMGVNPFANPPVNAGYRFARDLLYQFKIDHDGDFKEDFVVQFAFEGIGAPQVVKVFGPARPRRVGAKNRIHTRALSAQGNTGTVFGDPGGMQVFAGLREDPFVVDIGQFNRILSGTQEVFRNPAVNPLGLRGRPVRADGTSGTDGFGGFNGSFVVVEFPSSWVRGHTSRLNVWGTVSAPLRGHISPLLEARPAERRGDDDDEGDDNEGGGTFLQFERMGQQLVNTVFIPGPLKDAFNAGIPSEDLARWSSFVPDALTHNDATGNTIAGRAGLLTALGLTMLPNGAPLLLPADFPNTNRHLLRVAILPDVLRLDLDLAPNDLAIGQFGLQNGRRLGDDVVDIALRLLRQLADVNFPAALGVPGSGPPRPGALNFPADRRVFAVLQGTDFYELDGQVEDLTGGGNEKALLPAFPYLAAPHPLPGEPGTIGFPPAQ